MTMTPQNGLNKKRTCWKLRSIQQRSGIKKCFELRLKKCKVFQGKQVKKDEPKRKDEDILSEEKKTANYFRVLSNTKLENEEV